MRDATRAVILGQTGGWHERRLKDAFEKRGAETLCLPVSRLVSSVGEAAFGVSLNAPIDGGQGDCVPLRVFLARGRSPKVLSPPPAFVPLRATDAILVRALPSGSLEQTVYRMDALHALGDWGCRVINSAETIERSVDKFHASFLIERAGLPTPRTFVAERFDDAMERFAALGGDAVLKPLFGSEGKGIVRISDADVAYRTFRALEVARSVYYLQEYLPSRGWDLRVLVLGGRALGCVRRAAEGWKTNVSLGARTEVYPMTEEIERLALETAKVFAADCCGVDLFPTPEGFTVIEANGIPGWRGFERATGIPVAEEIAKWTLSAV